MESGDAKAEVAIARVFKASILDHLEEGVLVRKASDRLDKILIAVPVASDGFAKAGNNIE